jgi:uncharacterized protein (DUF1501 family)
MHTNHDPHACKEYNELSRRSFVSAAAASPLIAWAFSGALPRVALAKSARGSMRDVIVSIYLRGASDGLTMCVPHADDDYYAARPQLAIPRPNSGSANAAINLDGFFGLPPAMQPLLPAYLDGRLLFVHACGSTDPSRSHFEAQRYMEVGVPRTSTATGWLGRHLASVSPLDPDAPLRGVGISTALQQTLVGGPLTIPVSNIAAFDLTGNGSTLAARRAALADMYAASGAPLAAVAATTIDTISLLDAISFETYVPANGATYPATNFGTAMKSAAALIKAQAGVEAIAVDIGGWDTHNAQGNTGNGALALLMSQLAGSMGAFYADMNGSPNLGYTVVAMSEFGRRVSENASQGTDHGHGNAMLVMGTCVTGGRVLANWPGLAVPNRFEGLDLQVTTDYRDVLAEIVQRRLGNANLDVVFPNHTSVFHGVTAC